MIIPASAFALIPTLKVFFIIRWRNSIQTFENIAHILFLMWFIDGSLTLSLLPFIIFKHRIDDELCVVQMKLEKVELNKPIYVGSAT